MTITFLIVVILGLFVFLIMLVNDFQQQKIHFQKKENKLLNTIVTIRKKQIVLNEQVKISEDFYKNYQKSRNIIAETIYQANLELIKNNVEKK